MNKPAVLLGSRAFVSVLSVCMSYNIINAAVVFEAGFRGPGGGTGGAYDLVSLGGTGKFLIDSKNRTSPRVTVDNPMSGGGAFFSCPFEDPTSSDTLSVMSFTPVSPANSLDAMTSVVNEDRVINGGFDFFFRSDKALLGSEMRALDVSNTGNGGLRFVFTSQSPGLRLENISNTGGLLVGSESGSLTANQSVSGAFTFESNTVYHLGVSYETDTNGTVTAKIWGQEGTGEIDLTTATPVASVSFGINEDVVTSGFSNGSFNMMQLRFGNISYDSMVHEYDQFRIYDATPTVFGELEEPPASWRDVSPEVVLQADFNGAGTGTGGPENIVAFGGTATLYDAGTYSDASVIDTVPFKSSGSSSSGGYLSILTTNNVNTGYYGRALVTPSSPGSSLSSMTVYTNGHVVLRGGLDFFFRSDLDILTSGQFRPIDTDNKGNGGLRLVLYNSGAANLRLEIISSGNGLYTGGEGGATVTAFAYDFVSHLVSNTIYHVGITFDGTDDGDVTASVWLKEGTGEINIREEIPAGSLTFGINESVVTNGFTSGSFNFGKILMYGEVPSTQDYDCLRIYNETPIVLSALYVPPAGTIILFQ